MTDLELAGVLRAAAAALRRLPPRDWPLAGAALGELAQLVAVARPGGPVAPPPLAMAQPVIVKRSIHEPVGPVRPRVVEPPLPRVIEDYIARILDTPPRHDETIDAAYRRKEAELGALFGDLTPPEARVLRRRLVSPAAGDSLAAGFARLAPDRRTRLLIFLGDARRREALRQAAA